MRYYLVLTVAIVANSAANILIKIGMNKVGGVEIASLNDIWQKFLMNYVVWLGIICFGIALLSYSFVLSHIQLSIAYPIMTSVGFILVIVVSLLYLNETLSLIQIIGIVLILFGVWLVAR